LLANAAIFILHGTRQWSCVLPAGYFSTWSYDRLLSSVRGTYPTQPQAQIFITMSVELERVELELHSATLAGLYRICGGRLSNQGVTYEGTKHKWFDGCVPGRR